MEKEQKNDIQRRKSSRFYSWKVRQDCLELPFPMSEYGERLRKTQALVAEKDLEAVVICGDTGHKGNVRWLANWEPGIGNAFLFVPAQGEVTLVLNDEVPGYNLCATWVKNICPPTRGAESFSKVRNDLLDLLHDHKVRHSLGIIGSTGLPTSVTLGLLKDNPQLDIVDASSMLMQMRAIKSSLEIEKVREAVRQSDVAIKAAVEMVREGVPEKDVVGEALRVLFVEGATDVSFMPIVVAGSRSIWKHALPTSRPIHRGEPVYIDLGASYQGYCGDLSRTVFLGQPTPEQANILEFALAATEAVKQAARPGVPARRLREIGNEVGIQFGLRGKGYGTGHGIGCSLREEPLLDPDNELLLQPGMTISLEPMYIGELGTAVIEDNILITMGSKDGL
ncbi:unnamed protein product [marine sediment metagenome]|uniref:Uncharacterized protein n=1 Tax=marine sediment metagenome TaxID=412755 RepID=X1RXF6_9ZZZZ